MRHPTRSGKHAYFSFNPRTCKGATGRVIQIIPGYVGFNPRTCKGATSLLLHPYSTPRVSIHAPVKVRLIRLRGVPKGVLVSIHAPVKVRLFCWQISAAYFAVSIHAPVKVRLDTRRVGCVRIVRFNPRTCKGATSRGAELLLITFVSIHAPVKVRHGRVIQIIPGYVGFNPRTCKGATRVYLNS